MDVNTDVSDLSEEAYRAIIDSAGSSVEGLKNCSLNDELNDAAQVNMIKVLLYFTKGFLAVFMLIS